MMISKENIHLGCLEVFGYCLCWLDAWENLVDAELLLLHRSFETRRKQLAYIVLDYFRLDAVVSEKLRV